MRLPIVKVPLNPSGRPDRIAMHGDGWMGRLTISEAVLFRDRLTVAIDYASRLAAADLLAAADEAEGER